jgi:hypothetical protein
MPERRARLHHVRTEQEGHERPEVVEDGPTAASAVFANSDSEIAGGAGSATDRNPRCRDAHLAGRQEVLIRVRRIRTAPLDRSPEAPPSRLPRSRSRGGTAGAGKAPGGRRGSCLPSCVARSVLSDVVDAPLSSCSVLTDGITVWLRLGLATSTGKGAGRHSSVS